MFLLHISCQCVHRRFVSVWTKLRSAITFEGLAKSLQSFLLVSYLNTIQVCSSCDLLSTFGRKKPKFIILPNFFFLGKSQNRCWKLRSSTPRPTRLVRWLFCTVYLEDRFCQIDTTRQLQDLVHGGHSNAYSVMGLLQSSTIAHTKRVGPFTPYLWRTHLVLLCPLCNV